MKKFLASVLATVMLLSTLVTSTVLTSSAETVQGQVVAHTKWTFKTTEGTQGTKTTNESLGRTTYAVTAFSKGAVKLEWNEIVRDSITSETTALRVPFKVDDISDPSASVQVGIVPVNTTSDHTFHNSNTVTITDLSAETNVDFVTFKKDGGGQLTTSELAACEYYMFKVITTASTITFTIGDLVAVSGSGDVIGGGSGTVDNTTEAGGQDTTTAGGQDTTPTTNNNAGNTGNNDSSNNVGNTTGSVQGQVVAHSKWGFESVSSKTQGTKTTHESLGRTTYAVTAFSKGAAKLEWNEIVRDYINSNTTALRVPFKVDSISDSSASVQVQIVPVNKSVDSYHVSNAVTISDLSTETTVDFTTFDGLGSCADLVACEYYMFKVITTASAVTFTIGDLVAISGSDNGGSNDDVTPTQPTTAGQDTTNPTNNGNNNTGTNSSEKSVLLKINASEYTGSYGSTNGVSPSASGNGAPITAGYVSTDSEGNLVIKADNGNQIQQQFWGDQSATAQSTYKAAIAAMGSSTDGKKVQFVVTNKGTSLLMFKYYVKVPNVYDTPSGMNVGDSAEECLTIDVGDSKVVTITLPSGKTFPSTMKQDNTTTDAALSVWFLAQAKYWDGSGMNAVVSPLYLVSGDASIEAPTNPTQAPTNPTQAPTNPTEAPTNPTEAPTNPTEAPTNPTEAPTNPTDAPTNPTVPTHGDNTTAPTNPNDVNADGSLNISDIQLVKKALMNLDPSKVDSRADVNGDGAITPVDYFMIKKAFENQ